MNTVAIIQARTGSSRLPGKIFLDICGTPILGLVIARARAMHGVDSVVVATSVNRGDDLVEQFSVSAGAACFRGDENDVLRRFHDAAVSHRADAIVRITADCPFIDPETSSKVVARFKQGNVDYASNIKPPTYPDGLDTEVFSMTALARANREAPQKSHREHVTPYIWKNPKIFRLANIENDRDLSHLRWTVDKVEDLDVLRAIGSHLPMPVEKAMMRDILAVLDAYPEISQLNRHLERNESMEHQFQQEASARPGPTG